MEKERGRENGTDIGSEQKREATSGKGSTNIFVIGQPDSKAEEKKPTVNQGRNITRRKKLPLTKSRKEQRIANEYKP